LLDLADGGTLFVDDVDLLSLGLQSRLLLLLSGRPRVRVVAASRVDLSTAVLAGRFSKPLYRHLTAHQIDIPPLRQRASTLAGLASHLLARAASRYGREVPRLGPEVLALIEGFDWPENMRQLQVELDRALLVCPEGGTLSPQHLVISAHPIGLQATASGSVDKLIEAGLIRKLLAENAGSRTKTAKALGVSRQGLFLKMKRYGIVVEPKGRR
jgi:DNA-binding NtrC family response regulator